MRILLCLLLAFASSAQAGTNPSAPGIMAPKNALPPESLAAIQNLSQILLQARLEGRQEASADNEQLALLNAAVNKLIAAEDRSPNRHGLGLIARMRAHIEAWDAVSSLRQDAGQLQPKNQAPAQVQVYSGGLPVGEQRGRLFDKWADELETIINSDDSSRLEKLKELQARLTIQKHDAAHELPPTRSPSIHARGLKFFESIANQSDNPSSGR